MVFGLLLPRIRFKKIKYLINDYLPESPAYLWGSTSAIIELLND